MGKLLLLSFLFTFVFHTASVGQAPDPPGCYSYAVLDYEGDGVVSINMPTYTQYMFDFFEYMTGFDASVSYYQTHDVTFADPSQIEYIYTQGSSQVNIDTAFHYTGSGPEYVYSDYHLSFPYLGCKIIFLVDPDADQDQDGISNADEDVNGDGVLENDDSNGNGIPDYDDFNLSAGEIEMQDIRLFPNPATSSIFVTGTSRNAIAIFDMNGRKIKDCEGLTQISVSELDSGIYLMKMESGRKTRTLRFIKQ